MKTEHTPGPWKFDGDWWQIPSIIAGDGKEVASLRKLGYPQRNHRTPEQEANARLIAAAPDMLAALEKIAWAPLGDPEASPADCLAAAEEIARAAIRRAKGEG